MSKWITALSGGQLLTLCKNGVILSHLMLPLSQEILHAFTNDTLDRDFWKRKLDSTYSLIRDQTKTSLEQLTADTYTRPQTAATRDMRGRHNSMFDSLGFSGGSSSLNRSFEVSN